MLLHASPEFLHRHIPKILAGEELWVQFFSEPEAGSDLAGIRTRATRDGDRWILNGAKIWSSGAYYADYGMCLARTNWDVPKHRGLTWFAVATKAPGVTIQPITEINGDAEFCQEFFDDVELSDEDVIGDVDQGWRVAQTMLVFERGGGGSALPVPSVNHGLAPDLVALARKVGRTARSGGPPARSPGPTSTTTPRSSSALVSSPAAGAPRPSTPEASPPTESWLPESCPTCGAGSACRSVAGRPCCGSRATIDGMTSSLNYLNGRIMSIAGGTNEMQRNAIGERVLGPAPRAELRQQQAVLRSDPRRPQLERPGRLTGPPQAGIRTLARGRPPRDDRVPGSFGGGGLSGRRLLQDVQPAGATQADHMGQPDLGALDLTGSTFAAQVGADSPRCWRSRWRRWDGPWTPGRRRR